MSVLFAMVCGVGGLAVMRLLGADQQLRYLLLVWPWLVMLIYVAVEFPGARRDAVRREVLADNCYYLGFLMTLSSVSFSLAFAVGPSGNLDGRIDQVVVGFSIAMSSTILGVALRVLLTQQRGSAAESQEPPLELIEDQARRAAQTARELGETVLRNLQKLDSELSNAIDSRIAAAAHAAGVGMERRADTVADRVEAALGKAVQKMVALHGEETKRSHAALNAGAQDALQRLDNTLVAAQARIGDSSDALRSRLAQAGDAIAAGAERAAAAQAECTRFAFEGLEARLDTTMQQIARDHAEIASAALSGLAAEAEAARLHLGNAFGALPGQLADLMERLARQVQASTDELARGGESVVAAQISIGERAAFHVEKLAAQVGAIEAVLSRRIGEVGSMLLQRTTEIDRAVTDIEARARQAADRVDAALDAVIRDLRQKASELAAHIDLVADASARGTRIAAEDGARLREAVVALTEAIQGGATSFGDARVQIDAIADETEGARIALRGAVLEADKAARRLRDGIFDYDRP